MSINQDQDDIWRHMKYIIYLGIGIICLGLTSCDCLDPTKDHDNFIRGYIAAKIKQCRSLDGMPVETMDNNIICIKLDPKILIPIGE